MKTIGMKTTMTIGETNGAMRKIGKSGKDRDSQLCFGFNSVRFLSIFLRYG
jgi:hypothetical protein